MLAHLHVVIVQQLRDRQTFVMSWINSVESGEGRASIWLHPYGDLSFRFDGSRAPRLNPEWIARLTASATSSQGLIVTNEDGGLARSLSIREP